MTTSLKQLTPTISRLKGTTNLQNEPTTESTSTLDKNGTNTTDFVTFLIPMDRLLAEPYSETVIDVFFTLYIVLIMLSVFGNIIVIVVFINNRKLKTVTDLYIISLAISDLLIATLNMPFQLYLIVTNEWMADGTTGEALCKFTNYIQGSTIVCSILTLLAIAIDRYVVICQAKISHHIHRRRTAGIAVFVVWVISMVVVIPHLIYQKLQPRLKVIHVDGITFFDGVKYICVEEFPSYPIIHVQRLYSLLQYIIFYVLPVIIMAFTYGRIGHRLWIHQPIGDILENPRNYNHNVMQKRKIIRMLMLLFLSFTMLWFPFFTLALYSEFASIGNVYRSELSALRLVGYSNCCVNPFIYTFLNKTFRQDLSNIFCRKDTVVQFTTHRRTNETDDMRS